MEPLFISHDALGPGLAVDRVGSKAANLARLARIGAPGTARIGARHVRVSGPAERRGQAVGRGHSGPTTRRLLARRDDASPVRWIPALLVSVRLSPPVSMPGMLETVLNVGLTESATRALLRSTGNSTFVWDTLRRFTQGYAETVHGASGVAFLGAEERTLAAAGAGAVTELDPLTLRDLARESLRLAATQCGSPIPDDPHVQLVTAIEAVCRSWAAPRAANYRRLAGVDDSGLAPRSSCRR